MSATSPNVTAAKMCDLAEGGYIERAEPVLFIGECGTGKTHLLTGLCRQKRRVRFTTAVGLVNELVEAKHQNQLRRVLARWMGCRVRVPTHDLRFAGRVGTSLSTRSTGSLPRRPPHRCSRR